MSKNEQTSNSESGGFAGTLRNIQLTDVIQMCCLSGTSLRIRVKKDTKQGMIYIQEGKIVHSEFKTKTGAEAFFEILGWPGGHFETLEPVQITKQTIKEAYQFLLMEAARIADEKALEEPESSSVQNGDVLEKMRVLIVDDSPIMSKIINSMLSADSSIEVVGLAKNGEDALQKMKQLKPDLITMDVNMPVMDGSTAIKHIMIESPSPVLIMSNIGKASYDTILNFLNLGAVDFMSKPVKNKNIITQQQKMVDRVHIAGKAKVKRFKRLRRPKLAPDKFITIDEGIAAEKLIIVSSGVGGHLEVVNVITALPNVRCTSLLSLQSIPPSFMPTLIAYLSLRSRFDIKPVGSKSSINPGRCYIGPSGMELKIIEDSGVKVFSNDSSEDSDEESHLNSFDRLLFESADVYKENMVVILLSGTELGSMEGLHKVRQNGGVLIAPKLSTCILPATLEPAVDQGIISELFNPTDIEQVLKNYCV
ncbi:MAG: response regulator [Desulfobacteraceae bacterium]|nr:response regulator [Desulfobacteraceae bacterium]